MALPLTKPVKLPLTEERRRHQRVKVNLLGRYMLADRREFEFGDCLLRQPSLKDM